MKLKLTLILSGRAFQELVFDDPSRLRIGRGEDCEVWIDNLGVSRYHCEISNQGGILRLRDLDSSGGTTLNGVRVQSHNLNHGDAIQVGKFTIDVSWSGSRALIGAPPPPTLSEGDGNLTIGANPEVLAQVQEEGTSRLRAYLLFEEVGPGGAPRAVILDKSYLLIGKDPEAELRLGGGLFAPRLSAVIVREDVGFRILDLSPKGNAVTINGRPVRDHRLSHGQLIDVRGTRMTFQHGRPTEATTG